MIKKELFDKISFETSRLITNRYSTSFSIGIRLFTPEVRTAIHALYGFVRFGDEIVDSFHEYNQEYLLNEYINNYYKAIDNKISMNPIINAFQMVARKYDLHKEVDSFFESMRLDLTKVTYESQEAYEKYIYGSANVIGLMCLKIFVAGDIKQFQKLKYYAEKLGSALQKINFLRDLKEDYHDLGRVYFPKVNFNQFSIGDKRYIEQEIQKEFNEALIGIKMLPTSCRLGVFVAYKYYVLLLKKIISKNESDILNNRIRISNFTKIRTLSWSIIGYMLYKIN